MTKAVNPFALGAESSFMRSAEAVIKETGCGEVDTKELAYWLREAARVLLANSMPSPSPRQPIPPTQSRYRRPSHPTSIDRTPWACNATTAAIACALVACGKCVLR